MCKVASEIEKSSYSTTNIFIWFFFLLFYETKISSIRRQTYVSFSLCCHMSIFVWFEITPTYFATALWSFGWKIPSTSRIRRHLLNEAGVGMLLRENSHLKVKLHHHYYLEKNIILQYAGKRARINYKKSTS